MKKMMRTRAPYIWRLNPQYVRQSKLSCPTETIPQEPFSLPLAKTKTTLKLLWSLNN